MSREPKHGTVSEYNNHGCRCDLCREANKSYRRARRLSYKENKNRIPRHGTRNEYSNYGCRCEECRKAYSDIQKRHKESRRARGLVAGNLTKPRGKCSRPECTTTVMSARVDAQYCSTSCATTHHRAERGSTWRTAGWDRKQLILFNGDKTSPPVRTINTNRNGRTFYQGRCLYCGEEYVSLSNMIPRFCSGTCATESYKLDNGLKGTWIDQKSRLIIYERDNYTCRLCDGDVVVPFDHNNPRSATLDHIIPRSLWTGELEKLHEPNNLRTSCYGCNSARQNTLDPYMLSTIFILLGLQKTLDL